MLKKGLPGATLWQRQVAVLGLEILSLMVPMISPRSFASDTWYWYSVSPPSLNGDVWLPVPATDGTLLARQIVPSETLEIDNSILTVRFGTEEGSDFGLDALDILDPWDPTLGWPGLIAFSTELPSPAFSAGDLLFTDGSFVTNRALIESVFPDFAEAVLGEDHGLDAVDILPATEELLKPGYFNPGGIATSQGFGCLYSVAFSTEEDVLTDTAVLLASAGDILVTPPAGPSVIKNEALVGVHGEASGSDFGLDALDQPLPHHYPGTEETEDGSLATEGIPAVQFFSFEQLPPADDEPISPAGTSPAGGPLADGTTHGDALNDSSSSPYLTNAELVSPWYDPESPPRNLGLDALDVVHLDRTPTYTPTPTSTPTITDTPTPTHTSTHTATATFTHTATATSTPTHTPTQPPTPTFTKTVTITPTVTNTLTPTSTPTATHTSTPTSTPTSPYDIAPPGGDGKTNVLDLLDLLKSIREGARNADHLLDFARFWNYGS